MKTLEEVRAEANWHLDEIKRLTPITNSAIMQRVITMRNMKNRELRHADWLGLWDALRGVKSQDGGTLLSGALPEITVGYLQWQIGNNTQPDLRFGPNGTMQYPVRPAQEDKVPAISTDIRDRVKVANTYTATDGNVFGSHAEAYKHEAKLEFLALYEAEYGTAHQELNADQAYDFLVKHGDRLRIIIHIARGGH